MPTARNVSRPPARLSSRSIHRIACPRFRLTCVARSATNEVTVRASAARVACMPMVAALFALAACAGASTSARVGASPVNVARYGRLLAMADARRVDSTLIQEILRSGSRAERAAAALAIGQVHGTTLAPTLRTLLADAD